MATRGWLGRERGAARGTTALARTTLLGAALIALASSGDAPAQTVEQLCSKAAATHAVGPITAHTFDFGGVERHYCVYTSSHSAPGTPSPLLIALHGGYGNASQMMQDSKRIIWHAERRGYVAVFPNGLPRDSCGARSPCLTNSWGARENTFFLAELISRMKGDAEIDAARIHLVGFSGGAKAIYRLAEEEGFPHALSSVATVAGSMGRYGEDEPERGFAVIQIHEGSPVSAFLVQGGRDAKLPALGGLDQAGDEVHLPFRTKVDYWRAATGTAQAVGEPLDLRRAETRAPSDVVGLRYTAGPHSVVEVLDPDLEHAWPRWDLMRLVAEFFERAT